jgi:hypothetical protein
MKKGVTPAQIDEGSYRQDFCRYCTNTGCCIQFSERDNDSYRYFSQVEVEFRVAIPVA